MTGGIQITRTPDMKTITRSKHLAIPTENTEDIYREACELYHRHWKQDKPLRLLGVTLQRLPLRRSPPFSWICSITRTAEERIADPGYGRAAINSESAVLTAGMRDDPSSLIRNHKRRGTSLQMDFVRDLGNDNKMPISRSRRIRTGINRFNCWLKILHIL